MSPTPPSIQEISDNIITQLQSALNQTVPLLPRSFLRVLAKVAAGLWVLLYKYSGWVSLQSFVRTASVSSSTINGVAVVPLVEWGRLIGIGDPAAGTQAELLVDIVVTNQGGTLPSGSQLLGTSAGVTYITVGAVSLNAATVPATVRAVADQADGGGVGTIGNLNAGETISFVSPLPNVQRDALVVQQVTTGADAEDMEVYRERVVDRFQKLPQGGAYADYELWGAEPAGILHVYPYTSECAGQVDVYVEATPESSGDPDGIPTLAQLQEVSDAIERDESGLASRRPAGALVNVFPITRLAFNVSVSGLSVDNLGQAQADITAALEEYFRERAPYIIGLSVLPRVDRITSSAIGGVVDDITSAAGGVFASVAVAQGETEIELYTLGVGEKAKAGTVDFL
jgi:uncharacterized phage protein gp47/JayE